MTETRVGGMQARSTVFSLLVWLTQMAWCTSARLYLSTCVLAPGGGGDRGWAGARQTFEAFACAAAPNTYWMPPPQRHRQAPAPPPPPPHLLTH